jgi:hypothetical protein
VWSENQKQQRKKKFKFAQLLEVTGQEKKLGAPDTHAWLVRGQSRNVQEKSARAEQRRGDRTEQNKKKICMRIPAVDRTAKKIVHADKKRPNSACIPRKRFSTSSTGNRQKKWRAQERQQAKRNTARRRGKDWTGQRCLASACTPKKNFCALVRGGRDCTGALLSTERQQEKNKTLRAPQRDVTRQ